MSYLLNNFSLSKRDSSCGRRSAFLFGTLLLVVLVVLTGCPDDGGGGGGGDGRRREGPPGINLPGVPPSIPTRVAAEIMDTQIVIIWNRVADVIEYYIYRDNRRIATSETITTNTYTDRTFPNGGTYIYTIRAVDADGTSGFSESATVTIQIPAIQVIGGSAHTCVLLGNGSIECWGLNTKGQLGQNEKRRNSNSLRAFNTPPDNPIFLYNLTTAPTVRTLSTAVQISAGSEHTCARSNDGAVRCWGAGGNGQLGLGNISNLTAPPANAINLGSGVTATQVSVSLGGHTCVLLTGGGVNCWGNGGRGRLGQGNAQRLNTPPADPIDLGTGITATQIATGQDHTCALLAGDEGAIKCWGGDNIGQLGQGNPFSYQVRNGSISIGDEPDELGNNLMPLAF